MLVDGFRGEFGWDTLRLLLLLLVMLDNGLGSDVLGLIIDDRGFGALLATTASFSLRIGFDSDAPADGSLPRDWLCLLAVGRRLFGPLALALVACVSCGPGEDGSLFAAGREVFSAISPG